MSQRLFYLVWAVSLLLLASCGGPSTPSTPVSVGSSPIALALSAVSGISVPDGSALTVTANVTRPAGDTASVSLAAMAAPGCLLPKISNPGTGNTGSVSFVSQGCGAGTYSLTIQASDGATTASAAYALIIADLVVIGDATTNPLQEAMSTNFQIAQWDDQFFQNNPDTAPLHNLQSQHIRLQPVSGAVPQKSDKSWDFTTLNNILEPVAGIADKSPELQLATAPAWMCDSNGYLLPSHYTDFALYAANVELYYNGPLGFIDGTGLHRHNISTPITYWGIFNEPNYNDLQPQDYVALYNIVVPVMEQAATVTGVPIKIVGLELGDNYSPTQEAYIDAFARGVIAPVDIIATHYYATCNQSDTDETVFSQVTQNFLPEFQYLQQALQVNPMLANTPIWITENNVNADYADANGQSTCNPGQPFVTDTRGTSAFFAAWRPLVFSQLGQAGAQALYHWDYDADTQYGEADYLTGQPHLSYWVDYYLERNFPVCGANLLSCSRVILHASGSDVNNTVEILATGNPDSSVTVMLANHAVSNPSDNNATGESRTIVLDTAALGTFTTGTQLTIDATTNPVAGPTGVLVTPSQRVTLVLKGYGVTFLNLSNAAAHARKGGTKQAPSPPQSFIIVADPDDDSDQ